MIIEKLTKAWFYIFCFLYFAVIISFFVWVVAFSWSTYIVMAKFLLAFAFWCALGFLTSTFKEFLLKNKSK